MIERLECGHPIECRLTDEFDDIGHCEWCREVAFHKHAFLQLSKAIEGKAVIVNGGSPTIDGDVAYLVINSGTVYIGKCGQTCTYATAK